ncbi:MAG: kynureninase, partial [Alphaproteobacteria bacterium]
MTDYQTDAAFAKRMDAEDSLRDFRDQFHIPPAPHGGEALYFCGNSLGLQPKATEASVLQ